MHRRLVTVLFIDAAGSTRLSQQLDPEDIHAVLDGLLAQAAALVQAHEGRVLQFTGDGLLAAFGTGQAREDDTERAVRCALALAALGAQAGAAVQSRHGFEGFGLRAGVHLGVVLLGGGVDEAGTIRGMAVNVAARLEQAAPTAGVRISHEAWRLVRGSFDTRALPPLQAKPGEPRLASWLVLGEKPPAQQTRVRGVDGLATPLVGRSAELAALRAALLRAQAGTLQVLHVVAEAGLGKSRLRAEFEREIDLLSPSALRLHVTARQDRQPQPYSLLRDLLVRWLALADDASAPEAAAQWLRALGHWLGEPAMPDAALLGHLLGLGFAAHPAVQRLEGGAAALRRKGRETLLALLRALCARGPVVLMLEDLHWADDASLETIEPLLAGLAAAPLLVCALYRPAFEERHAGWPGAAGQATRLALQPLGQLESLALAQALLHKLHAPPPELLRMLQASGDGVPFYQEEVVNMLIDRGAIDAPAAGQAWQCDLARLREQAVPASLQGVMQSRVDALQPRERTALRHAAVLGHQFWAEALEALAPGAAQALPELTRRGLVRPEQTSAFAGCTEYRFVHQLMQQSVYENVLRAERVQGHRRAAAWLGERVGDRADEHLAATAEHHARAGDGALASEYLRRAADAALQRGAGDAALALVARGLSVDVEGEAIARAHRHLALLSLRAQTLQPRGEPAAEAAALDQAQALADAAGSVGWRLWVQAQRASLANRTGQHEQAIHFARQALDPIPATQAAPATPADEQRARQARALAHGTLVQVALNRKAWPDAMAHAQAAYELVQLDADPQRSQGLLVTLAMAAHGGWQVAASERHYRSAAELARQGQWPQALCRTLVNWAVLRLHLGDLDQAQALLDEALPLARKHGFRISEASALYNLALLRLWQHPPQAALQAAEQAAALGTELDMRVMKVAAHLLRSQALRALGQAGQAWQAIQDAADACDAQSLPAWHATVQLHRATMLLQRGEGDAALALAQAVAQSPAAAELAADDRLRIWRVLHARQSPLAAEWLQRAQALVQAQADAIEDPATRAGFVKRIPAHAELLAAGV